MPNATVNTASAMVIEQLTGPARVVRLVGRALPFRPFTLKTKQRVEITELPGSPVATGNVFGGGRDRTSCRGKWSTKYLGEQVAIAGTSNLSTPMTVDGQRIETVVDAVALFETLVMEGQLVRVTWDAQVREGLLEEFEPGWHNRNDIEWSMSFAWISAGEVLGPPSVTEEASVGDAATIFERRLGGLKSASVASFPTNPDFNEAIAARLTKITGVVGQVSDTVSSLTSQTLRPYDAARRTVALTNTLVAECRAMRDEVEAVPPRTLLVDVGPVEALSLGAVVAALAYTREMQRQARALEREAIIRRAAMAAAIGRDLAGTYTARAGDDLRDVSRKFYGTPFEWRRLLTFNSLGTTALTAGQLVLVPRIVAGGSG